MPSPVLWLAGARDAWRHPWQLALAISGVALGVAVVVAVDLSLVSAQRAFAHAHAAVAGRATHVLRAGPSGVEESLYAKLRREAPDLRLAPVLEGYVIAAGEPPRTLRVLGVDPLAEAPFRRHLGGRGEEGGLGRLLVRPDGVAMSAGTAASLGIAVGERFAVRAGGRPRSLELLGLLATPRALDRAAASDLLVMDVGGAQALFGRMGYLSRIDVVAEAGADIEVLRARLPSGVALHPAERERRGAAQMSRSFEINLRMLGLLALVVGVFLVYNTMTFSVLRRRALIGQFRVIGVTRVGVFGLVMAEALAITGIATGAGLGFGILLAHFLLDLVTRTLNDHYFLVVVRDLHLHPLTLLKAPALGIGAGLLAAALPALEATRTPPRIATLHSALETRARRRLPLATGAGLLLLAGGGALLAGPVQGPAAGHAALFALLSGCALLVPAATRGLLHGAGRLFRRRGGAFAAIVVRGAASGLGRSAVAVAALTVALAVTLGIGVMVDSFRKSVEHWLDRALRADLYVGVPGPGTERTLPPALADRISGLDAVREVSLGRALPVDTEWGPARLLILRMAEAGYAGFELLEGDFDRAWPAFDAEDAVLLSEPFAWRSRLRPGERLTLRTAAGPRAFEVAGVYRDYESTRGTLLMSRTTFLRHWPERGVSGIGVYLHAGREAGQSVERIRALLPGDREIVLRSSGAIRQASLETFDRTFTITGVLRLLACTVAFLGVWSALVALSLERAREVAVLRALGLTRGEVFVLVQGQTGLLGLIAGLLSVPVGLGVALILVLVINRRSFGWSLSLHVDPMLATQAVGLALLAALLAGLVPAWRMARGAPARGLRAE